MHFNYPLNAYNRKMLETMHLCPRFCLLSMLTFNLLKKDFVIFFSFCLNPLLQHSTFASFGWAVVIVVAVFLWCSIIFFCIIHSMGFNGRECVLRALCETSQLFGAKGATMIKEMLRTVFR